MSKKKIYRWRVVVPEGSGQHEFLVDAPTRGNAEYKALRMLLSSGTMDKRPPRNTVESECLGAVKTLEIAQPERGEW